MTQEERQILLKDLCARLPYGVMYETPYGPRVLNDIFIYSNGPVYTDHGVGNYNEVFGIELENIKPYLRPMSSMTKEEAIKVVELCVCSPKDVLSVSVKQDCISVEIDDGVAGSETYTIWFNEIVSSIELFDWLNAHHLDYRGLIPMELALEAPEDMYKER